LAEPFEVWWAELPEDSVKTFVRLKGNMRQARFVYEWVVRRHKAAGSMGDSVLSAGYMTVAPSVAASDLVKRPPVAFLLKLLETAEEPIEIAAMEISANHAKVVRAMLMAALAVNDPEVNKIASEMAARWTALNPDWIAAATKARLQVGKAKDQSQVPAPTLEELIKAKENIERAIAERTAAAPVV